MRKLLLTALIILASGAAGPDTGAIVEVSLIQLLARPLDFDGRRVRVVGYVTVGFEEQAVFLNPQDYENGVLNNSVVLHISTDDIPFKSNEYALVEGVFHAETPTYHVRGGPAEFNPVTKIEPWSPSAKSRAARARGCW
jgi:hypothetical protein